MKKLLLLSILMLAVQLITAQEYEDLDARASMHFKLLLDGDYKSLVSDFDGPMLAQIDRARLEQIWLGIESQLGSFEEVLVVNAAGKGSYVRVTLTSAFEKGYLKSYFTYNSDKQISGIFFTPEVVERQYNAPLYVDKEKFVEQEHSIGKDGISLDAVLSLPKLGTMHPLVILVHGSGPLDKDLSIEKMKPFRDLAWGLASRGIAVLRYDKRTFVYGASTKDVSGGEITPENETIEDVIAAIDFSQQLEGIEFSKVYVFGHSLGAMLASGIENKAKGRVKGYILAGGSPRPLEKIIYEQYKYVLGLEGLTKEEKRLLKELKTKVKKVQRQRFDASTPDIDLPLNVGHAYWSWLSKYDPIGPLLESEASLLLLHAEKDYQVVGKDLKAWQKRFGSRAQTKSYEKLYHPFVETEASPLATPSDYLAPGHVPEYVILDIWEWINKDN